MKAVSPRLCRASWASASGPYCSAGRSSGCGHAWPNAKLCSVVTERRDLADAKSLRQTEAEVGPPSSSPLLNAGWHTGALGD